jgi:hypothetical protein
MGNFEDFQDRVEQAATQVSTARDARQKQNRELMDMLARLEQRCNDRDRELEVARARIEPLERENAELSGLIARLLEIVEDGLGAEEALDKASGIAAALLEQSTGNGGPPEMVVGEPEADNWEIAALNSVTASAANNETGPGFEETSPESLAEEALAGDLLDTDAIPDVVQQARMAARRLSETDGGDDPIAEVLNEAAELAAATPGSGDPFGESPLGDADSEITIPEPEAMEVLFGAMESDSRDTSPADEPSLDVRSLLARVEEIARKTGVSTEIDTEIDTAADTGMDGPAAGGEPEAPAPEPRKDEQVA